MREIKFRAWDKDYKKIINVDEFDLFLNQIRYWKDKDDEPITLNKGDFEIMQFTGLKDKNGKEIYEGDIFDCIYKRDGCNHKLVVDWQEDSARFRIKNFGECDQPNVSKTMSDLSWVTVIGNKFENPELLKNGDKRK